jgi:hypothetical protein
MKQEREYFAVFYMEQLYYLPHFLPVVEILKKRNLSYKFVLVENLKRDTFRQKEILENVLKKEELNFQFGFTQDISCKYFIGGNHLPQTPDNFNFYKSVLIFHGGGNKGAHLNSSFSEYDLRFIEEEFVANEIKRLYPESETYNIIVGYSKLDPILNYSKKDIDRLYSEFGLDKSKKTILYAPTFFPTSFDKMSKKFPEHFSEYNILVKPHSFTYLRKRYKKHIRKMAIWDKYPNTYMAKFEDYNLIPFFAISDIVISDESTAIYEFAALDRPVIWNRFIKWRWSYILNPKKMRARQQSGMEQFRDIGTNVYKYSDLKESVLNQLNKPDELSERRRQYSDAVIGLVDGKVSERIVDFLENYK